MSGHITPSPSDLGHVPAPRAESHGVGGQWNTPGEPPASGAAKERLGRYLASVWRFRLLVIGATVLGGAIGLLLIRSADAEYTASARIWVNASESGEMRTGPIRSPGLLQAGGWTDLLHSPLILAPAVYEQRLFLNPDTLRALPAFASLEVSEDLVPGSYQYLTNTDGSYELRTGEGSLVERGRIGGAVGSAAGFRWTPPGGTDGEPLHFTLVSPREATRLLGGRITSRMQGGGNFLRIEHTAPNAAEAAAIVNSVAERYVEVATDLKRARLDELEEILLEQLEYSEANLRAAEGALTSFRINTITLPSDRGTAVSPGVEMSNNPALSDFFSLSSQREQLRRDRQALERVLARSSGALSLNAVEVIPSVRASSALPRAISELNAKHAEHRVLRERYTPDHPEVQRVEREIQELEGTVIPDMGQRLIREFQQREAELSGQVQESASELRQIPARTIEEGRLERSVAIAGNIYTTVRQRYEEARLASETAIPDLRLLDLAHPPQHSGDLPGVGFVLAGLLIGFGVGVVGAAGWTHVDPKIRFPEEVTRGLGVPILGIVPDMTRQVRGSKADMTEQAIEAFREIRLNAWHAHGRSGPLMLTITSPGAGDGKSFVAANLALAFADAGFRTLLVDGDLRRGTLHGLLGAERKPGVADYLLDSASGSEIVQSLQHSPLAFIGCGTRDRRSTERLVATRMTRMLNEVRADYEVIIIDSPPVGAGADAFALGTITGNLLFVLRAGTANRDFVSGKLDLLDRLPVRLLGSVLNGVSMHRFEGYFPYVSGYEPIDERDIDPFADDKELADARQRLIGNG
jgi:polysaccharide biosynthesis transport protein